MSHITLKDYIKQLENQGYDYNTRVAMAKEWASTHQPKSESAKTDDFTNTPDPDVKFRKHYRIRIWKWIIIIFRAN